MKPILESLVISVGRLAADADQQLAYLSALDIAESADEIALEFDDVYRVVAPRTAQFGLSREAAESLAALDKSLDAISEPASAILWSQASLVSAPEWERSVPSLGMCFSLSPGAQSDEIARAEERVQCDSVTDGIRRYRRKRHLRMVVVRLWWRASVALVSAVVGIAVLVLLVSFVTPWWRMLDSWGAPLFVSLAVLLLATMATRPRMGKREFLRHFVSVPRFTGIYYRATRQRVLWSHLALFAFGVAVSVAAIVIAPYHPGFDHANGTYYVIYHSPSRQVAVSLGEFTLLIVAWHVWSPIGGVVLLGTLLLSFICADQYLGTRPELWPEPRKRH